MANVRGEEGDEEGGAGGEENKAGEEGDFEGWRRWRVVDGHGWRLGEELYWRDLAG